jgi:hypothetical protein
MDTPSRLLGAVRVAPRLAGLLALMLGGFGCYRAKVGEGGGEAAATEVRIIADAYSFNARIWRDGKPTSFKLELYCTDSLIGVGARGYLGKGAFKGWLSRDSIRLYFPTSREVLDESLDDLVKGADCGVSVAGLGFLRMFLSTPDSVALPAGVALRSEYESDRKAAFRMESQAPDCPWKLELDYDRQERQWTPKRLEFDNGHGLVLRAERERLRVRIGIAQKRFEVDVPPDAARIVP